ncbi:kelch repeat-containing protein [Streptomyces sp. NPDC005533]|uniref:Kelch repeat-containing protein n=1 Tax=Streptomyces sp. NPDC005533 TaxID=3364723 RepID=UPI00368CB87F
MRRIARSDQDESPPGRAAPAGPARRTGHRGWRRLAVAALAPLLALSATTATAQGVWVHVPNMPTARSGLASTGADCPEGLRGTCVYAAGGNQAPEKFEAYSPASGTWATLPALKTPRHHAAATTAPCPNGVRGDCVYVLGGAGGGPALDVAEAYSTETNVWLSLRDMNDARTNAAAATAPCPEGLQGTCVYAYGGNDTGSAEAYNPATNTWASVATLPTPRSDHAGASARCPGDTNPRHLCVYAISGTNANPLSVDFYDPVNNQWGPAAEIPTARVSGRAATAPCPDGMSNGCIYTVGGNAPALTTVEAYTPVTNVWVTLPSTPTGHTEHGVAAAPCPKDTRNHCVYAVGGVLAESGTSTTEAFAIERENARPQTRPEPLPAPTTANGPRPDPAQAPPRKPDAKPQPDGKPWQRPEPKPDAKPAPRPPAADPDTGLDPDLDPELDLPTDETEDVR